MLKKDLVEKLIQYINKNKTEEVEAVKFLRFIGENDDILETNVDGHITASAWCLTQDKSKALLTHHKKLNRWLQLGGHVEKEDKDILGASLRELSEESGMNPSNFVIVPEIFDIDVHIIPERKGKKEHYHWDIRFAFFAIDENYAISDESNDLSWVELESIKLNDSSIKRMIEKTRLL